MMQNKLDNQTNDALLQINTSQIIEQDLHDNFLRYFRTESTDYYVLDRLFPELTITNTSRLVDMGCGTGRVLIYSAFKLKIAVVGIEFMKSSYEIAQQNIAAFTQKMGDYPITILNQTVETYEISPKDTIFYFFNPFNLQIMRKVIYAIKFSLEVAPRTIQIVLYYPLIECVHFIENRDWLTLKKEIRLDNYRKDNRERILIYQNNAFM